MLQGSSSPHFDPLSKSDHCMSTVVAQHASNHPVKSHTAMTHVNSMAWFSSGNPIHPKPIEQYLGGRVINIHSRWFLHQSYDEEASETESIAGSKHFNANRFFHHLSLAFPPCVNDMSIVRIEGPLYYPAPYLLHTAHKSREAKSYTQPNLHPALDRPLIYSSPGLKGGQHLVNHQSTTGPAKLQRPVPQYCTQVLQSSHVANSF